MLDSLARLLDEQVGHGFAMDWVSAGSSGIHATAPPAEPSAGEREPQPSGSYDAIRVYLWVGIADPGTRGQEALLGDLAGMAGVMRSAVTPPLEVDAMGHVIHADAPVGFSAAVIPFLQASGMKAQAKLQQDRLIAAQDPATGLYGHPGEYYDENLALFSTGWSEERYRFNRDGNLHLKWK
jgi:endoglucanase